MASTFGVLDAIALVFAVLIAVATVIIVFLGQLPGRIARQRAHPQAAAINVADWLGLATLGLLWPIDRAHLGIRFVHLCLPVRLAQRSKGK